MPNDPIVEQQQKLQALSREISFLTVAGMRDNLSPEGRAMVHNLERSARAEAQLRRKGLAWLQEQQASQPAQNQPAAPQDQEQPPQEEAQDEAPDQAPEKPPPALRLPSDLPTSD